MSNRWMRNSFVYLLIIVAVLAIFFNLFRGSGGATEVPISEVIAMAKAGRVNVITVDGNSLEIATREGTKLSSRKEEGSSVLEMLRDEGIESGVEVKVRGSGGLSTIFQHSLQFPSPDLLRCHPAVYDAPGPGE